MGQNRKVLHKALEWVASGAVYDILKGITLDRTSVIEVPSHGSREIAFYGKAAYSPRAQARLNTQRALKSLARAAEANAYVIMDHRLDFLYQAVDPGENANNYGFERKDAWQYGTWGAKFATTPARRPNEPVYSNAAEYIFRCTFTCDNRYVQRVRWQISSKRTLGDSDDGVYRLTGRAYKSVSFHAYQGQGLRDPKMKSTMTTKGSGVVIGFDAKGKTREMIFEGDRVRTTHRFKILCVDPADGIQR
jgi:hypothetical protein